MLLLWTYSYAVRLSWLKGRSICSSSLLLEPLPVRTVYRISVDALKAVSILRARFLLNIKNFLKCFWAVWDVAIKMISMIVMMIVVIVMITISIITATRQCRSAYTVRAQYVPVMTVAFPFEHDMRHVNIVAAAFASLSDSDLHCIKRCDIELFSIRLDVIKWHFAIFYIILSYLSRCDKMLWYDSWCKNI